MMGVLTRWESFQCICVSDYHVVPFKYFTFLFVDYTLMKLYKQAAQSRRRVLTCRRTAGPMLPLLKEREKNRVKTLALPLKHVYLGTGKPRHCKLILLLEMNKHSLIKKKS